MMSRIDIKTEVVCRTFFEKIQGVNSNGNQGNRSEKGDGLEMKRKGILISALLLGVLLCIAGIIVIAGVNKSSAKSTFAKITENELFQEIPMMIGETIEFSEVRDVGDDNYAVLAEKSTLKEYQNYLNSLEKEGFKKYVDNGEKGLSESIYSAQYEKGDVTVYVSHMVKLNKTLINVCKGNVSSPNLFYDDSYVSNNIEGLKTSFHLPELHSGGNSFIFQLKNGHFIINDGAYQTDLPYLLDYLEKLAPAGEKPVVDAWIISHAHSDHMGVFQAMYDEEKYTDRISVEAVYYNEPSGEAIKTPSGVYDNVGPLVTYSKAVSSYLKNSDGEPTPLYRPRVGERYYFNDITIDVLYTQELIPAKDWLTWNSSSTMLMYTIEDQKVFITGDSDYDCQIMCMNMFDSSYFDLNVYQAPHHGINVYKEFAYRCENIDTIIYPTYTLGSAAAETAFTGRAVQNAYLKSRAKEAYCFANGTVVLTFPYEVGKAKILEPNQWIYDTEEPKWKAKVK